MRFLVTFVVAVAVSAVALIVAAALLDGFQLSALSFPIVVLVFSLVATVARPVVGAVVEKHAQVLTGAIGLITVFITLLVTDVLSDGLDIEGARAWIIGPLLVWLAGLAAERLLAEPLGRRLRGERAPARPV